MWQVYVATRVHCCLCHRPLKHLNPDSFSDKVRDKERTLVARPEAKLILEFLLVRVEMVNCSNIGQVIAASLFEYDTAKIVHIKSKKVGLFNRLIQLLIIGYIIG